MLTCDQSWEIGHEVGLHQTIISRIFNAYLYYFLEKYGRKLYDNLQYFRDRLELYNLKMKLKIQSMGHDVPLVVQNISCFTDGTRIQICRPNGPHYVQREFYHGKDKIHCFAFQVTTGMDGLVMDMFGFPGSRHDSHIFNQSQLNQRFANIQVNNIIQYKSYMDKGYIQSQLIISELIRQNGKEKQIEL